MASQRAITSGPILVRLAAMMFLQYFVWGAWAVSLGGYLGATLNFKGYQIASIYSSTAIAAMVSPIVMGYLADRFLATERLLAMLHLAGAGLLCYAAGTREFTPLYVTMIAYALCYMPTLALTNSISFENIDDTQTWFPLIRVFGTLGWIAAGAVVGFVLDGKSSQPIWLAAAASGVLGLYSFALPHTPPKGAASGDAQGDRRGILALLAEPSFAVFVVCSFLVCIPLAFYYNLANLFLVEIDAWRPTFLQTFGQMSEVGFMAAMPLFIRALGVKRMLAIGMLAWVVRYFFFGSLNFPLVFLGVLLHGICYDFFFVASQIYVDSKADARQRATAQSFIAFVTLGLGMFVGAYAAGTTLDLYPPPVLVQATDAEGKAVSVPLPDWDPEGKQGFAAQFGLRETDVFTPERMTSNYIDGATGTTYTPDAVRKALASYRPPIAESAAPAELGGTTSLTRAQWRLAQRHDWFPIWLWPGLGAGVTLALFLAGFRDRVQTPAEMS